ncbi:methyltransferase family protein [Brevibacterium linens]|uniref:Protein-S-isoprenylcysteine O-methyltransferase Ste14 n=1 Tax=Brevibacterium linens ATCC 9172 TaxID=1255617 RepID=A0A2H1JGZ9_BRELN|nr:isoprenylcysteine carboxylmethyltransferase family protein [Brevibacterium linens]KAB1947777.1 isoprenylcysteine carboxylmethyltransferase family protein [Brevibacterium linens ATCC 9172]SMX86703.1 Protein-S-isoprenylcysteine O-methyltransferase Ste14 [Brevibacterium linens ATCC 9172]
MNRHLTEVNRPKKRLRIFHGRMYFALQALAGAAWWLGTAMIPGVATATLGGINPVLIAIVDIPLFVIASALAALNFRWAVWIATGWTVLVALAMVIYATATTEAGLGAVLMILAALGSLLAGVLMIVGRIPSEKLLIGPFAFHSSHTRVRSRLLVHTTVQIVVFWGVFLIIIPVIINAFEDRWNLAYKFPILLVVVGFALLAVSSVIGVWSARAIANFGSGTPLPSQMAHHLVARGPYAFVRNPMAIAGVVQGMAMGLLIGSWLVIVYALIGSLLWNWLIRPHEETDLIERFGDEYRDYAKRVRCWWPTFSTAESSPDLVDED